MSIWARLREHKVLQWTLAYLGVALALAHGQELLAHTYHWPEIAGRLLMSLLVVGLPVVIALAWYHGHRGLTRISAGELTIVALLLLIGAGVLIALVRLPGAEDGSKPTVSQAQSAAAATATESVPPAPATRRLRIAVLPFENLSPEPENAFFTDGMHEEVMTALANSASTLEVISRTTMMSYKGKAVTVQQIAKDLGCTHVLEGSVRREGEEVRLTLQLIDAKADQHVWSRNFDRTLKKVMTLQSEVADEVARQLSVQLTGVPVDARAASPTTDPVAYDLYLKAQLASQELTGASSVEDRRKVADTYSAAIARDPQFGLAYLGRARLLPLAALEDAEQFAEAVRELQIDVDAARRLMGDDPRVLALQAFFIRFVDGDLQRAIQLFDAAEAKGLNDPAVLVDKSSMLVASGRMEEALTLSQRLAELDPGNNSLLLNWSANLWLAKQPEQALRVLDLLIGRWPAERREGLQGYRRWLIFMFSGRGDLIDDSAVPAGMDPRLIEWARMQNLRIARRYAEVKEILDHEPDALMRRAPLFQSYFLLLPPRPMAEERGWINLLLGDSAGARADGRATLAFVAQALPPEFATRFDWLMRLSASQGQLFCGENAKAAEGARQGLALMPRSRNALQHAYATTIASAVLAWAGAKDEAVTLLEDLAETVPGVAPATITRDPIYTVPLKDHPGYQSLRGRLEAQMATLNLQ
jgi:TolB-like protein